MTRTKTIARLFERQLSALFPEAGAPLIEALSLAIPKTLSAKTPHICVTRKIAEKLGLSTRQAVKCLSQVTEAVISNWAFLCKKAGILNEWRNTRDGLVFARIIEGADGERVYMGERGLESFDGITMLFENGARVVKITPEDYEDLINEEGLEARVAKVLGLCGIPRYTDLASGLANKMTMGDGIEAEDVRGYALSAAKLDIVNKVRMFFGYNPEDLESTTEAPILTQLDSAVQVSGIVRAAEFENMLRYENLRFDLENGVYTIYAPVISLERAVMFLNRVEKQSVGLWREAREDTTFVGYRAEFSDVWKALQPIMGLDVPYRPQDMTPFRCLAREREALETALKDDVTWNFPNSASAAYEILGDLALAATEKQIAEYIKGLYFGPYISSLNIEAEDDMGCVWDVEVVIDVASLNGPPNPINLEVVGSTLANAGFVGRVINNTTGARTNTNDITLYNHGVRFRGHLSIAEGLTISGAAELIAALHRAGSECLPTNPALGVKAESFCESERVAQDTSDLVRGINRQLRFASIDERVFAAKNIAKHITRIAADLAKAKDSKWLAADKSFVKRYPKFCSDVSNAITRAGVDKQFSARLAKLAVIRSYVADSRVVSSIRFKRTQLSRNGFSYDEIVRVMNKIPGYFESGSGDSYVIFANVDAMPDAVITPIREFFMEIAENYRGEGHLSRRKVREQLLSLFNAGAKFSAGLDRLLGEVFAGVVNLRSAGLEERVRRLVLDQLLDTGTMVLRAAGVKGKVRTEPEDGFEFVNIILTPYLGGRFDKGSDAADAYGLRLKNLLPPDFRTHYLGQDSHDGGADYSFSIQVRDVVNDVLRKIRKAMVPFNESAPASLAEIESRSRLSEAIIVTEQIFDEAEALSHLRGGLRYLKESMAKSPVLKSFVEAQCLTLEDKVLLDAYLEAVDEIGYGGGFNRGHFDRVAEEAVRWCLNDSAYVLESLFEKNSIAFKPVFAENSSIKRVYAIDEVDHDLAESLADNTGFVTESNGDKMAFMRFAEAAKRLVQRAELYIDMTERRRAESSGAPVELFESKAQPSENVNIDALEGALRKHGIDIHEATRSSLMGNGLRVCYEGRFNRMTAYIYESNVTGFCVSVYTETAPNPIVEAEDLPVESVASLLVNA